MSGRLERLRDALALNQLDAILVSQSENRRYLSGFTGSAGLLLVSQDRAVLATDFRYVEQAGVEAPDFEVFRTKGELSTWFPELMSGLAIRKLGFEEGSIPFSRYRELDGCVRKLDSRVALTPTKELAESLRAVKDPAELECLERASALADAALEEVLPGLQPGISENELAWTLERDLRERGSEPLPFEIIVASGPNSARPHARPTDRPIGAGEPVVIDLGARVGGYCSDMTRTVSLEDQDSTLRRIYDIVLGAQLTAMETLQSGMSGDQVDQLARTVVAQAGYADAFGHGLGHGVGLAPHEEPRLGPGSSGTVTEGMVFTIEPGIYIPGWGGVRTEDTVVLERAGVRPLTRAKKTWR
jgi:Xaa-Pro aminopeptidase